LNASSKRADVVLAAAGFAENLAPPPILKVG